MTNGHHRQSSRNTQNDNAFPDERLTEINICVKSPGLEEKNEEQSLLSGVSRARPMGPSLQEQMTLQSQSHLASLV